MNDNSILLGKELEDIGELRKIKFRENGGVYFEKI